MKLTAIVLVDHSPVPEPTSTAAPTQIATPDPGVDDLPNYYGGLVITLDDVGKTLIMRPQTGFLLRLGKEFSWIVTISPPDIITLNQKVTPEAGEQGVFIARTKGSSVLRAVGNPVCLDYAPPCAIPQVLFEMRIQVE